ncbi:MAG: hypothetical protein IJ151_02250 [Bacteroidales bacterium]|nr:hypothetical protein [Bacteroidales bacterium]
MKVNELIQIPDAAYAKGVSAPFCGMIGDALVVAGGANFPDKPLLEGGAKRVYADIWCYADAAWTHAGVLPDSTAYGATFAFDGKLLFAGGNVNGKTTDKVYSVSLNDGIASVTDFASLPEPMEQAGWAQDWSRMIIGGGVGTKNIYCFDAASGQWQKFAELPEPLVQPVFYLTGGKLYVWGGFNPETLEVSDKGLCYADGAWTEAPGIPDGGTFTGATGAVLPDGRLAVIGGVNREIFARALHNTPEDRIPYLSKEPQEYRFRKDVYVFDASSGWSLAATADVCALAGPGIAAAGENALYVAGGELKPGVRSPRIFKIEW